MEREEFPQMFQDDVLLQSPWQPQHLEQGCECHPVLFNIRGEVGVQILGHTNMIQLSECPHVGHNCLSNVVINWLDIGLEAGLEINQKLLREQLSNAWTYHT